ncbi:MAG: Exodeoxyribonuclease 7 small subunit [Alphaproteobacteria bacterium MarineAlpha6_Bin2]|jgi:exodeoxyribonuclease VII small subunit|nr:MAG: Exodeoxyribonuclease 7 small subunit [Alphaproteobacteria bacterium MarineAlpha6_Bin2]
MTIKKNFSDIQQMSFEKALEELEVITNDFEDGCSNLDQAVILYERGIALKEHCEKKLEEAKKKIEQVKIINQKPIPRTQQDSGEKN